MNSQGTASQRPVAWVLDNIDVDVIYKANLQADVGADLEVGLRMICQRYVCFASFSKRGSTGQVISSQKRLPPLFSLCAPISRTVYQGRLKKQGCISVPCLSSFSDVTFLMSLKDDT